MAIVTLGGIKVSRQKPKISVRIVNNIDSLVNVDLLLMRVGETIESLAYTPSKVASDYVEFTFDELLFVEADGRYRARLMIDDKQRTVFYLQLESQIEVIIANG